MPTCTWPELLTVGRSLKRPAEHWRPFVEQGPYARGGIRRPVIHIQAMRGRYYVLESTPTSQGSTRSCENWLLEFAWQHVGSHNPRLFHKKGKKKWTMSSQQQRVTSSQVNSLPAQMKDVSKCTRGILVWKSTYCLVSARCCLKDSLCWMWLKRNTTPS